MKPLVLIGGGGHCLSVIDVARMAGREILGILDEKVKHDVMGVKVLGGDDEIPRLVAQYGEDVEFLITVGQIKSYAARVALWQKVRQAGGVLCAPLISPLAHVAESATIGAGTVVMHGALVNSGARVGECCILNSHSIVEHCAEVGDCVHIATAAVVNGDAKIGHCAMIGSRSVVLQGVEVTCGTVVGAGAVVTKNITEAGVYVGTPAKKTKK